MVEKYIKDGKVAILHTNNWGTGWCNLWDDQPKDKIWDKELVEALLSKNQEAFNQRCHSLSILSRVLDDLTITWVPIGREFFVIEYDGVESIYICGEPGALIA